MRVTRTLMLFFAVAVAAGGCAQAPLVGYQVAAAPQGIDNVVYGASPGYAAAPSYGVAGAPTYAVPAAAPAYGAAAPAYNTAPAYGYATPAPAYGAAPATYSGYPGGMMMAAPVSYAPPQQPAYTLDSGDRLRVVVFGQEGLTNSYVLDASGQIDMPLIGPVPARGLTTDQLSGRIADMLRQGYVREPHVAVEVEAYRPFFILGEVAAPGQYPYTPNMTVETAVAIAGGFGPRGLRDSVIISRNFNGQQFRYQAPISASIRPGDTVRVQERWF
jgi:protein involved in polysaccharide export with SLBB domain